MQSCNFSRFIRIVCNHLNSCGSSTINKICFSFRLAARSIALARPISRSPISQVLIHMTTGSMPITLFTAVSLFSRLYPKEHSDFAVLIMLVRVIGFQPAKSSSAPTCCKAVRIALVLGFRTQIMVGTVDSFKVLKNTAWILGELYFRYCIH